jgi:uncharacterized paraquat-inducible protein A
MYWTIGSFPELNHLEPEERAAILRRLPRWTSLKIILRAARPAFFFAVIPMAFVGGVPVSVRAIAFLIVFVPVGICFYLSYIGRIRIQMRETIAEAFRGERLPFCMNCGYDLRAAAEERCPECGAAVKAR